MKGGLYDGSRQGVGGHAYRIRKGCNWVFATVMVRLCGAHRLWSMGLPGICSGLSLIQVQEVYLL